MIKDIAFTGYPVTDITKARAFYEGVLGLVPDPAFAGSSSWVEYSVGSNTFSIGCMDSWKPSKDGPSIAFEVDDMAKMVETLKAHNIGIEMGPLDFPTCNMLMIRDVDGNLITIHHRKS